ncbi:MAG: PspC domain-containing protein [Actinomycetales bacterium]
MNSLHRYIASLGLVRNTSDRILGGVCSGIGRRIGVDPWAIRLLFVLSLVLIPGSQIIIYPIAWVLMPDEKRAQEVNAAAPAAGTAPAATTDPVPSAAQTQHQGDPILNLAPLTYAGPGRTVPAQAAAQPAPAPAATTAPAAGAPDSGVAAGSSLLDLSKPSTDATGRDVA